MTEIPCPGPCNAQARKSLQQGERGVMLREGQPVWCRQCQVKIVAAIESLTGLAAGIFQMGHRTGQVARVGDVNGGRSATRIHAPTVSPAWEAIDELLSWAVDQERRLRDHLREGDVPRWRGITTEGAATQLHGSVAYLLDRQTALLCCPWANELMVVVGMARSAERAAGLDSHEERLTVACSKCEKPRLVRRDGSDVVRCRACGAVSTLG